MVVLCTLFVAIFASIGLGDESACHPPPVTPGCTPIKYLCLFGDRIVGAFSYALSVDHYLFAHV